MDIPKIALDEGVYIFSWIIAQGARNVALIGAGGAGKTSALSYTLKKVLGEGNVSSVNMAVLEPQSIHGIVGTTATGESRLFRHNKIVKLDSLNSNISREYTPRDPHKPACIICEELNLAPPQVLSSALSGFNIKGLSAGSNTILFNVHQGDIEYTHCALAATMNDAKSNPLVNDLPSPWSRRLMHFWIANQVSRDYFENKERQIMALKGSIIKGEIKNTTAFYGNLRLERKFDERKFPLVKNLIVEAYKSFWLRQMAEFSRDIAIKTFEAQADMLDEFGGLVNYDNSASRENCALAMAAVTANLFCGNRQNYPVLNSLAQKANFFAKVVSVAALGPATGEIFHNYIMKKGLLQMCDEMSQKVIHSADEFIDLARRTHAQHMSALYASKRGSAAELGQIGIDDLDRPHEFSRLARDWQFREDEEEDFGLSARPTPPHVGQRTNEVRDAIEEMNDDTFNISTMKVDKAFIDTQQKQRKSKNRSRSYGL